MGSSRPFRAWRGAWGSERPAEVSALPLPPRPLRPFRYGRLRKQWRYVAIHDRQLQLCAATITVGPARQTFWAIWDRENRDLHEGSHSRMKGVETPQGRLLIADGGISAEFDLEEQAGVETVTSDGPGWTWTRKQGGIAARGTVTIAGRQIEIAAPAIIDDSAGYHSRHTDWRWCSGVGRTADGRPIAWNFVNGINADPDGSEQTVWVDGVAFGVDPDPCPIASDLSNVRFGDGRRLDFHEEAVRSHYENRLIVRSRYAQPFGRFSGALPHAGVLAEGLGVMETHSVVW